MLWHTIVHSSWLLHEVEGSICLSTQEVCFDSVDSRVSGQMLRLRVHSRQQADLALNINY